MWFTLWYMYNMLLFFQILSASLMKQMAATNNKGYWQSGSETVSGSLELIILSEYE